MKKILALVTFLVVAAACSTEPPATPTANTNNATPATSTTLSEADAITKEKATWDTLKNKDYDGFGNLLASDYVEISGDGIYDKAGIVANVKDLTLTDVTYADWKSLPIDKDAVILMYQVTIKGTFKNSAIPPGPYRASSVWLNRDGKWQAIFYQETLAKAGPTSPPPPAATPAAKGAATPAAKAVEATTGPDAAANEKMVWEAIKSKNYDAFAAMLAPDAVEVEADGVYDKAGSVKGVSAFDASKFELSEWKTTRFDSDASLVTYMVSMPAMKGMKATQERHSTIWVNRAGKWSALFHQGTPAEAAPAAAPAATAKPTATAKPSPTAKPAASIKPVSN